MAKTKAAKLAAKEIETVLTVNKTEVETIVAETTEATEAVTPLKVIKTIALTGDTKRFNKEFSAPRANITVSGSGTNRTYNSVVAIIEFKGEKSFYKKIQVHKHDSMKAKIEDGFHLAVLQETPTKLKNLVYLVTEIVPLPVGTAVITAEQTELRLVVLRDGVEDAQYVLCDVDHFISANSSMGRAFNMLKAMPNIENLKAAEDKLRKEFAAFMVRNTVVTTKEDILPKVYSEFLVKTTVNAVIVQELKFALPRGFFSETTEVKKFELALNKLYNVTDENYDLIVQAFGKFINKAKKHQ